MNIANVTSSGHQLEGVRMKAAHVVQKSKATKAKAQSTGAESLSSFTTAWHVEPDSGPKCHYAALLDARTQEELSELPFDEAKAAGDVRKMKSEDMRKGVEIIILESFDSDSDPSSFVPENLEGVIENPAYRGGLVLEFDGLYAFVAKPNYGKIGVRASVVHVTFCHGREALLHASKPDPSLFEGVQWRDTSLAGIPLDDADKEHIQNYVGKYAFASNVASSILNGMVPVFPDRSSGMASWQSTSLAPLTKEVLKFDVKFATALNKLPETGQVSLWRGSWEFPATIETLRKKPTGLVRAQFQSLTLMEEHACNFLSSRDEPPGCRAPSGGSGCAAKGERIPTLYEFQTAHAKDLREWNEKEQEFVLLPQLKFDVVSIEKVENDRWYYMSNSDLVRYLRSKDEDHPGFPDLADAVEREGVSGADFVVGKDQAVYTYVDKLLGLYNRSRPSWQTGWPFESHSALLTAMKTNRFSLQCADLDVPGQTVPNMVPYYWRVVMKDAAAAQIEVESGSGGWGKGQLAMTLFLCLFFLRYK